MSDLPAEIVAFLRSLRRSERSINRLCNGVQMTTEIETGTLTLDRQQTALLLGLAHLSGWSADHIRLRIAEITGIYFKAEDIWSFHRRWVMKRGNGVIGRPDIEVMLCALKDNGIELSQIGRSLHETEQPVSHNPSSLSLPF
jgi:hypothetical protein